MVVSLNKKAKERKGG